MIRRAALISLLLLIGCSAVETAEDGRRIIAEWHTSDRAFRLDPVREDVLVFDDGRVEARFHTTGVLSGWKEFATRRRRYFLSPFQRDALVRLMRDLDQWRRAPDEHSGRICLLADRGEPWFSTETVIRYRPAPGLEWEVRRSWTDEDWSPWRMNEDLRRRLESVDAFFRELLWKD